MQAEKTCSYNEYFNQVEKDGLKATEAIIRKSLARPSTVYTPQFYSVVHHLSVTLLFDVICTNCTARH